MKVININFDVTKAFGNLYRKRCVLIAVEDNGGKVLTGAKPASPAELHAFWVVVLMRVKTPKWLPCASLRRSLV